MCCPCKKHVSPALPLILQSMDGGASGLGPKCILPKPHAQAIPLSSTVLCTLLDCFCLDCTLLAFFLLVWMEDGCVCVSDCAVPRKGKICTNCFTHFLPLHVAPKRRGCGPWAAHGSPTQPSTEREMPAPQYTSTRAGWLSQSNRLFHFCYSCSHMHTTPSPLCFAVWLRSGYAGGNLPTIRNR